MPAFKFPLAQETQYTGRLIFRSIDIPPSDAELVARGVNDAVSTQQYRKALAERNAAIADNDNGQLSRLSREYTDRKRAEKSFVSQAQDLVNFHQGGDGTQPNTRPPISGNSDDYVSLYLPQGLQFREAASYDNIDLGIAGTAVQQGVQSGSSLVASMFAAGKEEVSSLVDAFVGGGNAGIAAVRASRYLGDTVQNGVRAGLRITPNPNSRSLFKSIPIREFTFQFKLIPESKKEAEQIRNIIKWFRTAQLPGTISMGNLSVGYTFPNPIDITAEYDGEPIPGTKFLPAYIRDVTVTYNAAGMSFYKGGDWTSVDLSVSFIETAPITAGDID
jgi:hypothetical protein